MKVSVLLLALLITGAAAQLPANGVVTGRILNSAGAGGTGIRVVAVAVDLPSQFASLAVTDANGNYRLENIPTGNYVIAAGPIDALSYFPGVAGRASATSLSISSGAALSGIDFALASESTTFSVSGRISGNRDVDISRVLVVLSPVSNTSRPSALTSLGADKTFEFRKVLAGNYRLTVSLGQINESRFIGVPTSDIANVDITLAFIEGSVIYEGGPPPPEASALRVSIGKSGASVNADGTFFVGSAGGAFSVAGIPPGYIVKSVTQGEANLTSTSVRVDREAAPIRVVLSSVPAEAWHSVRGRLVNLPPKSSFVRLIAPRSSVMTGYLQTPLGPDGSFEFARVPKGMYSIAIFPYEIVGQELPLLDVSGTLTDITIPLPVQTIVRGAGRMADGTEAPSLFGVGLQFRSERGFFGGSVGGGLLLPPATYTVNLTGLPMGYSAMVRHAGNDVLVNGLALDGSVREVILDVILTAN